MKAFKTILLLITLIQAATVISEASDSKNERIITGIKSTTYSQLIGK